MRNKRTLQRGLSLLLAGGMALSSVGVTPVLAEEYTAPETVQATPETAAEETDAPETDHAAEEEAALAEEPAAATLSLENSAPIATYADETTEDDSKTISIDFSQMETLDDLGGWQLLTAGGTATLEADPADANSKALAIKHTSNKEAGIQYDGLDIKNSDYRYVTVSETFYLTTPTAGGQFCLPYLFNGNTVAYTLLTDGTWNTYKAQIDAKKNTKPAGTVKKDEWQTVDYVVDLQSNTFTVKINGETTLENATARNAVNQLTKFKFYSDDGNRSTVYLKSVTIKAEKDDTNKEPDKVYPPHATEPAAYYVSNNGDDDAAGTSPETAWKTVDRVNAETFIPGDKILFERGGEWDDKTLSPKGSGTAGAYITLGAYGDENAHAPRIAANGVVADAVYLFNQEYWEICDLDISNTVSGSTMVAGDDNPTDNVTERVASEGEKLKDLRGIHIAGNDTPSLKGFNIHNVRVHDVSGYVSWIGDTHLKENGIKNNYGYDGSKRTGGILIESIAPTGDTSINGQYTVFSDITIADSEFVNNSFGGIIVKQYNNGKARDGEAGWANREGASRTNLPDFTDANWHPHTNIVVTGNYINQGASAYACNGIYLCGVKDSVVEKNVLEHIGTCGIELFYADNVVIQYNEVSDVAIKAGGQDSNAIDPDWRTSNILIQYNYVRDCGEGLLLCGQQFNTGIIRYNLIQDISSCYIHYAMGSGYFQFYNNVFYRSDASYSNYIDRYGNGSYCSYVNNVFYDAAGDGFDFASDNNGGRPSMTNNAYYGAVNTRDTKPIILTDDTFKGVSPDMNRGGTAATGVLLEANGLQPKLESVLYAAGVLKDGKGVSIDDGLFTSGSKFNFTSLREKYDMNDGTVDHLVYIARTDYPFFDEKDENATLNSNYTQRTADISAPSIGLFERVLTADDIILSGNVTDGVSVYPDVEVTVTIGEKTIKATTDANGNFRLTNNNGLVAGEAVVSITVNDKGYTQSIQLEGGQSHAVTMKVDLPAMPDPYDKVVLNEDFNDNKSDVFKFNKGAKFENGQMVLTNMGDNQASVSYFSEEVKALDAVDFSFDYKYDNSNKAGFQFRDDAGNLLFAMCASPSKGEMRYSTTAAALTDDAQAGKNNHAAEPVWSYVASDTTKTYVVRVHADFAAGKVSYQIKEKTTGEILVQQLDVDTTAKNLTKMNICSWYAAKPQYIDNFVLTTPDKKSEPVVVDKEALQQAVSEGEKKVEADYTTGSWKDFSDALKAAKDILAKDDATQKEVDDATAALTDAAEKLVAKADTSKLEQAINDNKDKNKDNYTQASWADFAKALDDAQTVLGKVDPTQKEVDAATDALTEAAKNLVAKADTSKLEQAISDGEKKVEADYTQASWKDFSDALEAAKAVLAKVDPTQEEVDAATEALTKAAAALEIKPAPVVVDKKALQQAIEANTDKVEEDYTETSWADFAKAFADAQTVLDNPDATQAEVDAAAEALTKAAAALETKPAPVVVDKKALQQAIDANKDKVEDDYTQASWADFAKAFANAQTVLGKDDATQAEVDAAAKALTDAAAALKVKPTETPKPDTVTKVDNEPLSDTNIPDSLKEAGYDTPQKIQDKLKQESSQEFASDNLVVYDVTLKVSTDGGKTWQKATEENFPKDGLEVSFDLPEGITAETADQYTFVISHMKDDATVELLTPVLKDGKLTVTVRSLSPFGISWKAKEQPKPTEQPTATPAPTAKPSNSSTTPKATAAPKATDAPKATAAPAAPIPQTADSFPLVMLAVLALCSAAALAGLTICRSKKKH